MQSGKDYNLFLRMKKTFLNLLMVLSMGYFATSCVSEEKDSVLGNGVGTLSLSVTSDTKFQSRAVNESEYENTQEYTVQIIGKESSDIKKEFLYKEAPEKIELENGSYYLKAFYGEESNASQDKFYVEGISSFNIDGNNTSVSVTCAPTCAKVIASFASDMSEYFSDYSVMYTTKALKAESQTVLWTKDNKNPWYLKVDNSGEDVEAVINFTRKSDGKSSSVTKTYNMAPGKAWTLNVKPSVENGNLGISITINESTEDEVIDIIVPSDWI